MKSEPQLEKLSLVLTNKCNLKCRYCYQNSSPDIDTTSEMIKEEWSNVITQAFEMKVQRISLSGGEPLTYLSVWDILNYISSKGFYITLYSNGLLLDKKTIEKLKEKDVKKLGINLDSIDEKIEEYYKGKKVGKAALEAVILLKKENFEVSVIPTLTKKTFAEMDNYIQFCVKHLEVNEIEYVPLFLRGRSKDLLTELLNEQEREEAYRKIKSYGKKYKNVKIGMPCGICEAGISSCAIQPDGSVTPCIGMPDIVAGNIKKRSLSEIWYNSDIFKKIREYKLNEKCLGDATSRKNFLASKRKGNISVKV